MKKLYKASTILIAICLLLFPISAYAADNYIVLGGFAFDINSEGNAVIHSYDNRSAQVTIPEKLMGADVTGIDDYAFFGDSKTTSVSFSNATNLKHIGINSFYGCSGLTQISIPDNIESLGFGAFQNCNGLKDLSLGYGISDIPDQCFYGCSALEQVALPHSVTTIGVKAFSHCDNLRRVILSSQITQIADNAFDSISSVAVCCEPGTYAESFALANNMPIERQLEYILGDADGDSIVSIVDATRVQRVLAGIISDAEGMTELRSDANNDGLDILDATVIQRYLAQLSIRYNIGEALHYYVPAEITAES